MEEASKCYFDLFLLIRSIIHRHKTRFKKDTIYLCWYEEQQQQ